MKATTKLATLAAALFSLSAQAAPHDDQVADGQAAIINALVAGAAIHAPAELRQARETLDLSRRAIVQNDLVRAAQLADRAAAAALLAEQKALQQRGLTRTATR